MSQSDPLPSQHSGLVIHSSTSSIKRVSYKQQIKRFNVVVFGCAYVGKTAMIRHLCSGSYFLDDYVPTVDTIYSTVLEDPRLLEPVELMIYDTAGNDEYAALREARFQLGDAFIAVYSIIKRESFEGLKPLVEAVRRNTEPDYFPMILVGCKYDLEEVRQVSREEAEEYARQLQCRFEEISARDYDSVNAVFVRLVLEVLRRKTMFDAPDVGSRQDEKACCVVL